MRRGGFTLIEAIAATVLLGIAMPAMLLALAGAHKSRVTPVQASQARWLAAEAIEDVLADGASPARGWGYVVDANYPDEASVAGFPAYARTVSITETGPDLSSPGRGYKTATVTVSWVHEARERRVSLSTVLTELPAP